MKKNLIHRIFALLLVLVLSVSAVPAAFAESDPVSTLMEQFDNRVKAPKEASLLDEPEQMEVWAKYGRLIYLYSRPAEALDFKVGEAKEGVHVTVYAKQDGFALVMTEDGKAGGWTSLEGLDTKVHGEHPSFLDIPHVVVEGTYIPTKNQYNEEYETLYVKSTYGTRIYIIDDPRKPVEEQRLIGYAYEAEACTVLAELCGKLFVVTEKGRVGWVTEKLMVENYD